MKRWEFIALFASAAAWPLAVRAQQPAMPVIGFLDGQSFDPRLMTAFRQALKDSGYIEGGNVEIYYRSADGQTDRLLTFYGTSLADAYRQVATYTAQVLNGVKPADLPVAQLTKFEFVINLRTAKALNLNVPPGLLASADEIIE